MDIEGGDGYAVGIGEPRAFSGAAPAVSRRWHPASNGCEPNRAIKADANWRATGQGEQRRSELTVKINYQIIVSRLQRAHQLQQSCTGGQHALPLSIVSARK